MHIPSERIYSEMRSNNAIVRYVPTNGGTETALLIKAPTPSLKAMIAGCAFKLIYGKKDNFLCIGISIEDVPGAPLLISNEQIVPEEHCALLESVKQKILPIFLFNEMDICMASAELYFSDEDSLKLLDFIGDTKSLSTGSFNDTVSFAVDCFIHSIDKTKKFPNAHEIPIIETIPEISEWKTINIYYLSSESANKINITEEKEGANFESTIWSCLTSVFPETLYKNPYVQNGNKKREFTDVFAHYKYGSFLIETKDLSVFQSGYNRESERRVKGIKDQVNKGIKQLVGAVKSLKSGDVLFDINGSQIIIDRSIPPHCIILITELMPFGDWNDITNQLIDAAKKTGAFFHLLDFSEFITLLKQSSGKPELIDYNLMNRFKLFLEKKSVFIKGI